MNGPHPKQASGCPHPESSRHQVSHTTPTKKQKSPLEQQTLLTTPVFVFPLVLSLTACLLSDWMFLSLSLLFPSWNAPLQFSVYNANILCLQIHMHRKHISLFWITGEKQQLEITHNFLSASCTSWAESKWGTGLWEWKIALMLAAGPVLDCTDRRKCRFDDAYSLIITLFTQPTISSSTYLKASKSLISISVLVLCHLIPCSARERH